MPADIMTDFRKDMVPEKPAEPPAEPAATPEPAAAPAPEAAATPAPSDAAPAPEGQPAAVKPPDTSKGVPDYKKYADAMRYENKELKRQLAELAKKQAEMFDTVNKRLPEPAKPQPPDPTQDPVGALMAEIRQVREANDQRFEAWTRQQQEQTAQREHFERVTGTLKQINELGQQQHGADYVGALQHIVKLQAFPRIRAGMDEQEAYRQADLEVSNYALHLAQQGQNPVELVMEYARQYGYNPQPATVPGAPAPGQPPAADRQAEKTRQAVAAAKSASGGGAGGNGKAFTAADIDAMYDESPHKLADFKRQNPEAWEKYMQGKL